MSILGEEVKPHTIAVDDVGGGKMYFYLASDGEYYNSYGTKLADITVDPGFCGVSPFETGKGDPFWKTACVDHDKAFDRAMAGYQDTTTDNLKTFGNFAVAIGTGMVSGAYQVLAGPYYLLLGGVYGFFREQAESK